MCFVVSTDLCVFCSLYWFVYASNNLTQIFQATSPDFRQTFWEVQYGTRRTGDRLWDSTKKDAKTWRCLGLHFSSNTAYMLLWGYLSRVIYVSWRATPGEPLNMFIGILTWSFTRFREWNAMTQRYSTVHAQASIQVLVGALTPHTCTNQSAVIGI